MSYIARFRKVLNVGRPTNIIYFPHIPWCQWLGAKPLILSCFLLLISHSGRRSMLCTTNWQLLWPLPSMPIITALRRRMTTRMQKTKSLLSLIPSSPPSPLMPRICSMMKTCFASIQPVRLAPPGALSGKQMFFQSR